MDFRTWRNGAREREKSSAAHRTRTYIPSVIDLTASYAFNQQPALFRFEDNLETVPTYEDLIPHPIRRRRQRRLVTPAITMVNNG
jgi:hypothetical protein